MKKRKNFVKNVYCIKYNLSIPIALYFAGQDHVMYEQIFHGLLQRNWCIARFDD